MSEEKKPQSVGIRATGNARVNVQNVMSINSDIGFSVEDNAQLTGRNLTSIGPAETVPLKPWYKKLGEIIMAGLVGRIISVILAGLGIKG